MRRAMDCYEEVLNLFVKDALRKSFPSLSNEINRMEQQQQKLAGLRKKEQKKLLELENAGAGTARDKLGSELKTIKSEVKALSNEKKEEMEERWVLECRLESLK